jgi:hypothetical protein
MQIALTQNSIALERYHALSMTDAAGVEVECRTGQLWLTQDGDTRDILLAPGDTHAIQRDGLTLISAIKPSVVHVQPARPRPAARRRWLERVWERLVSAGKARARAALRRGIHLA